MSTKTATRPATPVPGVVTTPTLCALNWPNLGSVYGLAHEMGMPTLRHIQCPSTLHLCTIPRLSWQVASTVNEVLMMEIFC